MVRAPAIPGRAVVQHEIPPAGDASRIDDAVSKIVRRTRQQLIGKLGECDVLACEQSRKTRITISRVMFDGASFLAISTIRRVCFPEPRLCRNQSVSING